VRPDDLSDRLIERYDRDAIAYRDLWAPVLRLAGAELLRDLAPAPTPVRRIVDMGCGVGSMLPDIAAAFPAASIIGVDRSRGMLAIAPPAARRAQMDATRLAIRPRSVDLVLASFMLFHLEEPADGLRAARRVLREGGRIACLTWGTDLESAATRLWTECLDRHGADPPDPEAKARHDRVDTPEKMEALLRAAAFRSVRAWTRDLTATIALEHLLALKTRLGSSRLRFESLAPDARAACLLDARRRMERLAPSDFDATARIVHAAGEA
jgi:SAM-dependent methyltransferase